MRRAIDFLAPLGLVIIVGSIAWQRIGRTLPGKPDAYLIAGAALILAHLLLRWEDVSRRIGRRQMKYGTNTAVLVLAVVGVLGFVNYLVVRHTKRWDLTKNKRYSLSDQTKKVLLAREPAVPADCTVMVVAGPQRDLLPTEIDALRRYAKGGGKLLVMSEPEVKFPTPNLDALAKEFNIELSKDIVVDVSPVGQIFGTGALTPIAASYPFHEITKDFRVMTVFHTARSAEAGKGTVEGVTVQNLLQTSPASWAETDLTLKEPVEMNEGKDRKGPISLGAVATVKASPPAPPAPASPPSSPSPAASVSPSPAEEPPAPAEGRVVVLGDSDFATNALLGFQGNQDFFLNTVAWLAQDVDLISIRAKEPEDQRLFVTRQQQQNVLLVSLLLVPGAFVVMGIAAWWKRRG